MSASSAAPAACSICGARANPWRTLTNRYGTFPILVCGGCGFGFVHPRPPFDLLLEFYSQTGHGDASGPRQPRTLDEVVEAERQHPNSTLDADRIVSTVERLRGGPAAGAAFLDVGCGYGFFSRRARQAGYAVTAIEMAQDERAIASSLAGVTPVDTPFEEFQAADGSFDVVLMSHILEHALDPHAWIERCSALLRPGGVLAVAVPNFSSVFRLLLQERESFIIPPAHLNYFSLGSLRALLRKHGFRVEEVQWVSRVPRTALERRLRVLGPAGVGAAHAGATALLRGLDAARLGMVINVYARR